MSNDLSIGAAGFQGPAPYQSGAANDDSSSSTAAAVVPVAPAASPGLPNPTLRLDPALGLVVIEFLSKSGSVTSSIPSQRELAAYQDGTAKLPGTAKASAAQAKT